MSCLLIDDLMDEWSPATLAVIAGGEGARVDRPRLGASRKVHWQCGVDLQ
jgi:hypothetical protein